MDISQSLVQLYHLRPPLSLGPDGKPSSFRSGLIDRCERLLVTALRDFEPGDLRIMLCQQFYPETLVPLALPLLETDPLLEAEFFPGDLLSCALKQKAEFWTASPDLLARMKGVLDRIASSAGLDGWHMDDFVAGAVRDFNVRLGLPSW